MTNDLLDDDTASELRALAAAASPAVKARPDLAEVVISRCRPRRRWARRTGIALGSGLLVVAAAASTRPGSGTHFSIIVPSIHMEPTVLVSEHVVFSKHLEPQHGDVVLAQMAVEGHEWNLVSRAVAFGGDTIACPVEPGGGCDAIVVNGAPVAEPHLEGQHLSPFDPVTIPSGSVFLMGDNRDHATDSRIRGPVALDRISGVGVRVVGTDGSRPIPGAPDHPAPGGSDGVDPADSPSDAPTEPRLP